DTSPEGIASPLFGDHTDAGDPIAAFDRTGRLFVGGIAFNRAGPINGDVYVATYGAQDQPNGYPVDYLRTRIVGRGTPSRNFQGIFQDKPMLEVDRTGGRFDGNVYVCWSRFTAFGQNRILFSRSTDHGRTFSRPISLTTPAGGSVQGCDIAIEADGDVYVTYRTFDDASVGNGDGLAFSRSANGGSTFSKSRFIRSITPYAPNDGTRNCGDGPFECPTGFVFHRVPLEPRSTADQSGGLRGVVLTYNAIRPRSVRPSTTSYSSAGSGRVGQSLVYVIRSLDNGRSWSRPKPVDPNARGHQFFPDVDALDGRVAVVWQDSRTDQAYSVQRPIGNTAAARSPSGRNEVNTFVATSENSRTFSSTRVSSVGHQSEYEMFGNRDVPFHGDYNWISFATASDGSLFGYMTWTDNRNVVGGTDPREETQDGFDVLQCREDLGAPSPAGLLSSEIPLARRDAPFGGDTCGNGGGLDQDIYGNTIVLR
nr:exo-alpha-sialidase [Actinomycetota bacterium]